MFSYGAFRQLAHNGAMIRQAENILNNAVKSGIYVAVENPDGTRVMLQPGFKLIDFEMVAIYDKKDESED